MSIWQKLQHRYWHFPSIGLALDFTHLNYQDAYFDTQEDSFRQAHSAMKALEAGAIANPDEKRMVGHYWLREPSLAPQPDIQKAIEDAIRAVQEFAKNVHNGSIQGASGRFTQFLLIGIGGSALGPQFVAHALGHPDHDAMTPYFLDNTDPDGLDKVFAQIKPQLGHTLTIVISKSGGTKETRNGMLETQRLYEQAGLDFAQHAVAITGKDSQLDNYAKEKAWLTRFPMWDWVGGRTSELSAVGLLPAALQGFPIKEMLRGAKECDDLTRIETLVGNPAALMALAWHYATNGVGSKDMVVLPYKDRLELFSRYLQQLLMESLGKELNLQGKVVHQGLTVYGNKGSTDQHAYVQQLRDGVPNFFVTFLEVLHDRQGPSVPVEDTFTTGDFLFGFLLGTREALYENGRESLTLTIESVDAYHIGVLIALFERTVGYYASMIGINAYHQPGVEAGKKAAGEILQLQKKVLDFLEHHPGESFTVEQIAQSVDAEPSKHHVFKICQHLSRNRSPQLTEHLADKPSKMTYSMTASV